MVALPESKVGIRSGETKSPKEITLPEQHICALYRNGTGRTVEEKITERSFEGSEIVEIIRRKIESFRPELNEILRKKRKLLGKKKHGGRSVPKRELSQRLEALEKLAERENTVRELMAPREKIVGLLRHFLEASNPIAPLRLRISPGIYVIDIIEGTPMEEGDQEWWRFIREEDPKIWDLHQAGQKEDYEIVHALFLARFELREAKLGPLEKEGGAQAELDRVVNELELISDKRYVRIGPIIDKITEYFPD